MVLTRGRPCPPEMNSYHHSHGLGVTLQWTTASFNQMMNIYFHAFDLGQRSYGRLR